MGCQIVRAEIRFHFYDATDSLDAATNMDQMHAQQFLRNDHGVPVIKTPW
jgi:hypothetical protein